jgi:hypothetical protein
MKKSILNSLALSAALCAGLVFSTQASASSVRCGVHLIQGGGRHGPTQFEVLRKCGEPRERRGNNWYYRMNGRKFELRFDGNGILNTVKQVA